MALETGTYISDLVATNPTGSDPKSQGDDHLRLLKSTIQATFPNVNGAVTPTPAEMNVLDGAVVSAADLTKLGQVTATSTELNYVDGVTSAIQTQMDLKAPLASPALTGTPTVPTAAQGTDTTQAASTAFVRAELPVLIPAGSMTMFGGASVPTGWLACDGSAISRTTYADLFAAIGTAWGVGDGSTTFNLPDMLGRAPIGVGTGSGLTARSLGDSVGAETHQLSEAEMASHNHGVSQGTHTHTVTAYESLNNPSANVGYQLTGALFAGQEIAVEPSVYQGGQVDGTATINAASAGTITESTIGSDTAHNNMQPSAAVNFIIKT